MPANPSNPATNRKLSLDAWAVIGALLLAACVRFGLINSVPW